MKNKLCAQRRFQPSPKVYHKSPLLLTLWHAATLFISIDLMKYKCDYGQYFFHMLFIEKARTKIIPRSPKWGDGEGDFNNLSQPTRNSTMRMQKY